MSQFIGDRNDSSVRSLLIDTHCHLDDDVFADDLESVLRDSRSRGITRWVNVGFEPARWRSTIALMRGIPGMFHMLGLHPGHAGEWSPELRTCLRSLLTTSQAVAVGEIGLDFFRGETNASTQRVAFDDQLDLAIELNLPAVVHMRAAENEVLGLLKARKVLPRLVFHSFDGTMPFRDFVVEIEAMVGVGGLATRASATDLRLVIETIPPHQILLETDSPYLVPKGARGRRNVPGNITDIADVLADLLGMTRAAIAGTTTGNAERVFGLAGR